MQIKTIMRCHLHPPDWQNFRSLTVLLVGEDSSLRRPGLGYRSWASHNFGNAFSHSRGTLAVAANSGETLICSLDVMLGMLHSNRMKVLHCSQWEDQLNQEIFIYRAQCHSEKWTQDMGSCLDLGLDL